MVAASAAAVAVVEIAAVAGNQRLFVAIEIGEQVSGSCEATIRELAKVGGPSRVNWVGPHLFKTRGAELAPYPFHLTLKFLGSRPSAEVPRIESVLAEVAKKHEPFSASIEGLGTFPPSGSIQVIWAGVGDGADELARIALEVDRGLGALGLPLENKEFIPHLTLGRAKERGYPRSAVNGRREIRFGSTEVRELVLFESKTLPTGAVYRILAKFGFK